MVNFEKMIKSLWCGRCTVYLKSSETDEATGREHTVDKAVIEDEPCRISFENVDKTQSELNASKTFQKVVLYISPYIDIPAGSKIVVTQHDKTYAFHKSGVPAVYMHHQEIPLELEKEWT